MLACKGSAGVLPLVAKLMLGVCVCVSVACSWLLSVLVCKGSAGMLLLVAKLMLGVSVCVCVCVCQWPAAGS